MTNNKTKQKTNTVLKGREKTAIVTCLMAIVLCVLIICVPNLIPISIVKTSVWNDAARGMSDGYSGYTCISCTNIAIILVVIIMAIAWLFIAHTKKKLVWLICTATIVAALFTPIGYSDYWGGIAGDHYVTGVNIFDSRAERLFKNLR